MPLLNFPGVSPQIEDAGLGALAGLVLAGGPVGALAGGIVGWLVGGGGLSSLLSRPINRAAAQGVSPYNQGIIDAAGADVAGAVAGAVASGDTSLPAQANTVSVTGGIATIQGAGTYVDPLDIPNSAVRAAWLKFVAQMRAVAAMQSDVSTSAQYGIAVFNAARKYAPAVLGALASAGVSVGTIGGLSASSAVSVLALDAALAVYGFGSLVESFLPGYTQSPAEALAAQALASAYLTGNAQLAAAAQAVGAGSATAAQLAYVQSATLSAAQIQNITTNETLASGGGSKQLYDPAAPGGYIIVGGQYGVKQAQTAAQNYQEAAAGGQTAGGPTEAIDQQIAREDAAGADAGNTADFNQPI